MIKIKTFYFNELRECTYILWDETSEGVIIDPGCYTSNEEERLSEFIKKEGINLKKILLTHGHFDHIAGASFVSKNWDLEIFVNDADLDHIRRAPQYGSIFGWDIKPLENNKIRTINHGEEVVFGNSKLNILHTPGHTKGGVVYVSHEDKIAITGDTLFAGSIGRTDLPGGDYDELIYSLNNKVLVLGNDYKVYAGHGSETTIGVEKETNPYLT